MKILYSMLILFLILTPNITTASSDIKKIKLDDTPEGSVYFQYNPDLTKLLLNDVTDKESEILTLTAAELRLSASNEETIVLEYPEDPSVGAGFIFLKK